MQDQMRSETPIIGVVGWKDSGKTTFVVRLIEEFKRRGLKVASIKHAHHKFQIDGGDTDSARHRQAGASQVAIVSKARWAVVTQLDNMPEPGLTDIVAALEPADIIIVEGYKSAAIPKIETRRKQAVNATPLSKTDPQVIAIAADYDVDERADCPIFDLDNVKVIADYLEKTIGPLVPRGRKDRAAR